MAGSNQIPVRLPDIGSLLYHNLSKKPERFFLPPGSFFKLWLLKSLPGSLQKSGRHPPWITAFLLFNFVKYLFTGTYSKFA